MDFVLQDLFDAARKNNLNKVREMLDYGVDINSVDVDRRATALHLACAAGAKNVIELLVLRGADLNAQDGNERTPLHNLVMNKFDSIAMYLVSKGANMHIKDRRGFSPYDIALPSIQIELKAAAGEVLSTDRKKGPAGTTTPTPAAASKPVEQKIISTPAIPEAGKMKAQDPEKVEEIKVYLENMSYKTIKVNSLMNAGEFIRMAADKFHIPQEYVTHLDLLEKKRGGESRVQSSDNILKVKSKWPTVLGDNVEYYFCVNIYIIYFFSIVIRHTHAYMCPLFC